MIGEKLLIISTLLIISVSGSALYGACESNENCGTFDTFCKNGTCVCRENFAVFYDSCVPLATPRKPCRHKKECHAVLGSKSVCSQEAGMQCVCRNFHHLHNGLCIKSRWIDEQCEFDHQCYCGENSHEKILCSNNICACKTGYLKDSRRCVPDPKAKASIVKSTSFDNSVDLPHYSMTLLITVLFFVKIL